LVIIDPENGNIIDFRVQDWWIELSALSNGELLKLLTSEHPCQEMLCGNRDENDFRQLLVFVNQQKNEDLRNSIGMNDLIWRIGTLIVAFFAMLISLLSYLYPHRRDSK